MSEYVISALVNGRVLELLLKATVVLGAAGLVAFVLARASAATRHLVWTAAVVGLLGLPLLTLLVPSWEVPVAMVEARGEYGSWAAPAEAVLPPVGVAESATAAAGERSGFEMTSAASSESRRDESAEWGRWLLVGWAVGTAVLLLRLLAGWWGVRRLSRHAEAVTDPEWTRLLKDAAWILGVDREVSLLRSSLASMPMTWGTLRPTVLLPVEADQWSTERRRVVLLHEMAHVARRDCLTQAFADLACALYWFHPLTWIAARRLRAERERACDDQVLGAGERASAYATHLLEVARVYRPVRPAGAAAIAMARPSQLEGRLLAVLDGGRRRRPPGRRAQAVAMASAALLIIPLAAVQTAAAPADELTSADPWGDLQPMEIAPPEPLAAGPEDRVIEREVAARPGESVRLDLGSGGDVRLVGWDRNTVSLRAVLRGGDVGNMVVDLARVNGGVALTSEYHGTLRRRDSSTHFELHVPSRSDVEIRSGGGGISMERISGTLSGNTGGGIIRLRNVAGTAALTTGGGEIHVSDSDLDGEVRTGGGDIRIVNTRGSLQGHTGGGSVFADHPSAPLATSQRPVTGETFRFRTGGGDVRIGDAPWGAEVSTGGGEIRIGSAGRDVEARTGGGSISIGGVVGRVNAHTGSGTVNVGPAAGPVKVTTGSGAVSIVVAPGAGARDLEITSGNGAITLLLPADFSGDFDLQIDASPNSGHEIRSDFELRHEGGSASADRHGRIRATGRTGNGAHRVQVRTANGDVVIRRATAGALSSLRAGQHAQSHAGGFTLVRPPMNSTRLSPPPQPPLQRTAVSFGAEDALTDPMDDLADFIEMTVEEAVDVGLRAAGKALSDADLGRFITEITRTVTQAALAAAGSALSQEERSRVERQVRTEVTEALQHVAPPTSAPRRR
jgi:beta-lactamase regulating signal transducer with metallopeptidase domain/DUF4097 and DUF4098 domain-containing protein YvlB